MRTRAVLLAALLTAPVGGAIVTASSPATTAVAEAATPGECPPDAVVEAPAPRNVEVTEEPRTPEESRRLDASEYARTQGVSLDEALTRLGVLDRIGQLKQRIWSKDPQSFGGLAVTHPAEGLCLDVKVTSGEGRARLDELVHEVGLDRDDLRIETTLVRRSTPELMAEEQALRPKGSVAPFDLDIDRDANQVVLRYADAEAVARYEQEQGVTIPDDVRREAVDRIAAPTLNFLGGQILSIAGCTSAFTVVNVFSVKGVLSAGHCGNYNESYQGRTTPYVAEAYSGRRDVQYYAQSGDLNAVNQIYDGTCGICVRSLNLASSWYYQVAGDPMCHFGKTTGYGCGLVQTDAFTAGYVPSAEPYYLLVESTSTDLSQGGDSGGPWFYGATAHGVHSGGAGPNIYGRNDAIVMSINWIDQLGVTVLTS